MANATSIYRRLTGRNRSVSGYSQLWLAPDHILLVKSTRFVEHYQRFKFTDIQAVVVTTLADRTPVQIAVAGAAALWTLGCFVAGSSLARDFFGITGVLALMLILADIALGPRCRCYLYTAVSRELLPVTRSRAAHRLLEQIRPAIEQVQGALPEGPVEFAKSKKDWPPEIPKSAGLVAEALFGLFLLDAALLLIDARFPIAGMSSLFPVALLGEFLLAAVALYRRDRHGFLYIVIIAALTGTTWDAAGLARDGMNWMRLVAETARQGHAAPAAPPNWPSLRDGHALIAALWRIAAGSAGLLAAWMGRTAK